MKRALVWVGTMAGGAIGAVGWLVGLILAGSAVYDTWPRSLGGAALLYLGFRLARYAERVHRGRFSLRGCDAD